MRPFTFPNDLLRLLYLVFFKPISLDRYIHQVDPTLGRITGLITLWRRSREHPEFRPLINLVVFHILFTPLLLGFLAAALSWLVGFNVNWSLTAFGLGVGIMFGLIVGFYIIDIGIGLGVLYGAGGGIALGVLYNLFHSGPLYSMVISIGLGAVFGASLSLLLMKSPFLLSGLALSTFCGIYYNMEFGMSFSVAGGGAAAASFLLCYFRLPFYIMQALSVWLAVRLGNLIWSYSPILWDEMIWLPLPGLDEQLVAIGKQNRVAGLDAIAIVAQSFRQGWAAKKALAELTLYDVQNACTLHAIGAISESLLWLPAEGRIDLKSFLPGIEQISQYARAALESDTLYNRQEQLRSALKTTRQMREGFAYYADWRFAQQAGPALQVWERVFEAELNAADQKEQIPNVYVAGSPLAEKSKVFKGRRDVFRALERELAGEAAQRPAILLFGARRSGKSSALKQLPVALGPNVVPVTVDLQSLALTNDAAGFYGKMAAEIKSGALAARHSDLPELPQKGLQADPYAAFAEWLKQVDAILENRWMLLCLDEYEYLEKMIADGRLDERAFQLLRAMLQNYPRLTLLFSGAHTFEELNPRWSHHLINVRLLKIGHLDPPDARELVVQPIPSFPLRYAAGAAEMILSTIGGQPYLLQAACRDLVNLLNEADRPDAAPEDVDRALESTLTSASAYFNELWSGPDSNDAQRAVLTALVRRKGKPVSQESLRKSAAPADIQSLVQHDVIEKVDSGYRMKVELVRRWVERQL